MKEAAKSIPRLDATVPDDLRVNGAGNFEVGGPEGDNGLSGKKLVIDAYGPRVPIGGGALSGKDFFKSSAQLALRLGLVRSLTSLIRELDRIGVVPGPYPDPHRGYHPRADLLGFNGDQAVDGFSDHIEHGSPHSIPDANWAPRLVIAQV